MNMRTQANSDSSLHIKEYELITVIAINKVIEN